MAQTPRGNRTHIAFFGKRNVGKSSLLNALVKQQVSIVSDTPGTTTDPVIKSIELQPLGPCTFFDTAGLDDLGDLGSLRVKKAESIIQRTDIGIYVCCAHLFDQHDVDFINQLKTKPLTIIIACNQSDIHQPTREMMTTIQSLGLQVVTTSAIKNQGLQELRKALGEANQHHDIPRPLIGDLIKPGQLVFLVVPIDLEAPKGRLILPQVQVLREILDHDAAGLVVKERELYHMITHLGMKPSLVITDSQAFLKVAADVPKEIPMTSFSILFARQKGDLQTYVAGAKQIDTITDKSKILIAESCSHHPVGDDIGRIKIPRWIRQYSGADPHIKHVQGHDFPADISEYDLVIQCGGCMFNRKEIMSRINQCQKQHIPITNYGVAISYCLGIFKRALQPFSIII